MKAINTQNLLQPRSKAAELTAARKVDATKVGKESTTRDQSPKIRYADAQIVERLPVSAFLEANIVGRVQLEPELTPNQKSMQDLAGDSTAFHFVMRAIYGDNYDFDTSEQLRQAILGGDFSETSNFYFDDLGDTTFFYYDEGGAFIINENILTEGIDAVLAPNEQQSRELACNHDNFHEVMQAIYGDNYDYDTAEQMRQEVLAGDFSNAPEMYFGDTGDEPFFYLDEASAYIVNEDYLNCDD